MPPNPLDFCRSPPLTCRSSPSPQDTLRLLTTTFFTPGAQDPISKTKSQPCDSPLPSSLQQPESPHRRDSLASLFPREEEERKGGCGVHVTGSSAMEDDRLSGKGLLDPEASEQLGGQSVG